MTLKQMALSLIILVSATTEATAQLEANAMVAPGAFLQAGEKTVAAGWAGFESHLVRAPDQGFEAAVRFGLFYVDRENDTQGMSIFLVGRKSFSCDRSPSIHLVLGGGLIYSIVEGYDTKDAALKIELGFDLYKDFGLAIGTDYIPDPLTDDKWFVYGALNLTPLVCN